MVASFRVRNNNPFPVKDFVIECRTFAPSGTVLTKLRYTLYEDLAREFGKAFKDVTLGLVNSQSDRAACDIVDAVPMKPHF